MSYPRQNMISQSAAPAANAAAVATFAAPGTNGRWRIKYVAVSYSAAPTGGLLTISDGANVNWQLDVPASGVVVLPDLDLQCGPNRAVTITLAAGGASVSGKVNAYATFE